VQPSLLEGVDEELGLAHGRGLQRGDDDERRAPVGQRAGHGLGTRDEALVHRLEQQEELGDVLEELRTEDAVGHGVEGLRGHRQHAAAGRHREPAEQAAGEEVGHPLRRLEEVDGVPRRRCVDDDQVEAAGRVDLVEALHRDVVVALHEPARDVLVERVGEDGVARGRIGGVATHEVVPRLLRVEHGGPQLAARLHPCVEERLPGHLGLDVAEGLEAQRVGQALGRVDGEHEHLAAVVDRGHRRDGGGGGGLPHAAGTAVDHDLLRGEELLHRAGRTLARAAGHQYPSSSARCSATWRVARAPWLRWKR
jgi:hypothetical protein